MLALSACGGSSEPDVDWNKYDQTGLRAIVDRGVASEDCAALQNAFDAADNSSAAYRSKYGEGNGDLMAYIDWHMRKIHCP